MNSRRLYLLGRRLMEISRAAASDPDDPEVPLGETVVLEDVLAHPDSSVGEITSRTGFAQSYVSTTVAKFRSSGVLETSTDPLDGRRTLVRMNERLLGGVFAERGARSVEGAVAEAVAGPEAARRAVEILEELARLLLGADGRRGGETGGGR